jgi:hypothetical protein
LAKGANRNRFLGYARASAGETDERLLSNRNVRAISDEFYWRNHHRLIVIIRIIDQLLRDRV